VTLANDNGTDRQTDGQTECNAICGLLLGSKAYREPALALAGST